MKRISLFSVMRQDYTRQRIKESAYKSLFSDKQQIFVSYDNSYLKLFKQYQQYWIKKLGLEKRGN